MSGKLDEGLKEILSAVLRGEYTRAHLNRLVSVCHALALAHIQFDEELRTKDVKSGDFTKYLYDCLPDSLRQGVPFYDEYLRHLAQDVRYWNGHDWEKQYCRIDPPPVP
jgi:hypothetical protein